ncbi:MAG TPA: GFA family protein [Allosphingosinicella sp.]|nr:GFA family protein [Allosphingosinicella sp.]
MILEGGCECGALRHRVEGPPIFVNCCHCRQCQKLSGSGFALNAMIEAERVDPAAGADRVERGRGGARCRDCGSVLRGTHKMFGEGILFLRVGTLDEGERLEPRAHFFIRSRHPWVSIPQGVPAFATLPQEGDPPLFGPEAGARLEAARRG